MPDPVHKLDYRQPDTLPPKPSFRIGVAALAIALLSFAGTVFMMLGASLLPSPMAANKCLLFLAICSMVAIAAGGMGIVQSSGRVYSLLAISVGITTLVLVPMLVEA